MPPRRSSSQWPYRLLLWTLVAIVALLVYLDNSPIMLSPPSEVASGTTITRSHGTDILVVIDYRAIRASADTFDRRDWSAAWIGLLEQEIGPVSVTTPDELDDAMIERARAIILTASVSDRVPENLQARLRQYALEGHLLVLERPGGALREAFAANGEAGRQRGRDVTFVKTLEDPYREQFLEMPLQTDYIGSTSPRDEAQTLMAIDGAPVVYALPIGRGTVVTVDFDLGEQLVSMQQGRPSNDFRVSSSTPDREGTNRPPTTGDLVMDSELSGSMVPYADLLERFIVHGVLGRYVPLPGLWPFPGEASGVVLPLHADRTLGDDAGWMLEYEATHDATSTLLFSVDAGLTPAGAAVVERRGGEVGLLWRRAGTPAQSIETFGVGGLTPLARPLTLREQIEQLDDTTPSEGIVTTQLAGRWWGRHWARPFRILANAGVRYDTSYVPTRAGFAYGTGLPFRALGPSGLPLSVRELPIVMPGRSAETFDLAELLEASRKGHHQALTYTLRPASFGERPNIELYERWIDSFRALRRSGHVVTHVRQFADFRRARRRTELSSRLRREVEMPAPSGSDSSSEETAEEESRTATALRITVEASRSDLSVIVPEHVGDRTFVEARRPPRHQAGRAGAQKLETERAHMIGLALRRIPLETGSTLIDVYYR